MKKTVKKIVCALSILCVFLTVLIVPISAAVPEDDQIGWAAFNYNYASYNLGIGQFRDYWNKARDQLPLYVIYGTGRYEVTQPKIDTFYIDELIGGSLASVTQDKTYITYFGHGNGFVGVSYSSDNVDEDLLQMGHLVARTFVNYIDDLNVWVDVELTLIQGGSATDIYVKPNNANFIGARYAYSREFDQIKYLHSYYGSYTNGVRTSQVMESMVYYGFCFGYTPGMIHNSVGQIEVPNLLWRMWFNTANLMDGNDDMGVSRYGMFSPLMFLEGNDVGYASGYIDGQAYGEVLHADDYQNGYDIGYLHGTNDLEQSIDDYYNDYWSAFYNSIAYGDAVQESIESNDSNPVTAFFTSMWNGVLEAYDIVTQNVTVGGISLAMVISTIVLAVVVWVIKVFKS